MLLQTGKVGLCTKNIDRLDTVLLGGRWDTVGRPVIYTSKDPSPALLENRVINILLIKDLMILNAYCKTSICTNTK